MGVLKAFIYMYSHLHVRTRQISNAVDLMRKEQPPKFMYPADAWEEGKLDFIYFTLSTCISDKLDLRLRFPREVHVIKHCYVTT